MRKKQLKHDELIQLIELLADQPKDHTNPGYWLFSACCVKILEEYELPWDSEDEDEEEEKLATGITFGLIRHNHDVKKLLVVFEEDKNTCGGSSFASANIVILFKNNKFYAIKNRYGVNGLIKHGLIEDFLMSVFVNV